MLRIRNWDKHYEKSRTRDVKTMQWLALHINLSSDGYATLMQGDDSYSMYGAWCAILQVASQCEPRGVLIRSNGRDHDAESIAMMSRGSAEVVARALDRLIGIGWIECIDDGSASVDHETTSVPPVPKHGIPVQKHPTDRTDRQDIQTPLKPPNVVATPPTPKKASDLLDGYPEDFETWYSLYPLKEGKFEAYKAFVKARKSAGLDTLMKAVEDFASSPRAKQSDPRYIKAAAPWLNQRCWEDDRASWETAYSDAPSEPENPGDWAKTPEEKLARFGLNPDHLAWVMEHGHDLDYPGVKGADHLLPSNRGK